MPAHCLVRNPVDSIDDLLRNIAGFDDRNLYGHMILLAAVMKWRDEARRIIDEPLET